MVLGERLGTVRVGKTRGPAAELRGCGWAQGRRSPLRVYLVESLPQGWSEDHEKALCEALEKDFGGEWVLLSGGQLQSRWDELSEGEKRRLRLREGFQELSSWTGP